MEDPAGGRKDAWACSLTGRKQGDAAVELHHKSEHPRDGDTGAGPWFLVCTIIAVIGHSILWKFLPPGLSPLRPIGTVVPAFGMLMNGAAYGHTKHKSVKQALTAPICRLLDATMSAPLTGLSRCRHDPRCYRTFLAIHFSHRWALVRCPISTSSYIFTEPRVGYRMARGETE